MTSTKRCFLSDVVHLMSPRPGRITLSLEVDLPRPRKYGEVVTSPHFNELKARLLEEIGQAGMKSGIWPPLLLGAGIIAAWETYVRVARIDPLLLPPPERGSAVSRAKRRDIRAERGGNADRTAGRIRSGVVIGLCLGMLMQTWRWFREAAYPWLVATQMVPIPAVAPILVLWFGFTIVPKAATVALMCFFPGGSEHGGWAEFRESGADPVAAHVWRGAVASA